MPRGGGARPSPAASEAECMRRTSVFEIAAASAAVLLAHLAGRQLGLAERIEAAWRAATGGAASELLLPALALAVATVWIAARRVGAAQRAVEVCERRYEERTRNRERELETRKLEALGTFAGGIAHEFNNALVSVLGYGELLRERLERDTPEREDLETMLTAARRTRDLVIQILTFSGKARVQPRRIDLDEVTTNAIALARASFPERVAIRHLRAPAPLYCVIDPQQIELVLLQLCRNAADALPPDGGTITVELDRRTRLPEADGDAEPLPPGSYACLQVSDNGVGMDAATCERIFEPFYTTKQPGEGTGLGLSVVHGIVRRAGGAIDVESRPGEGTTVRVYLPVISTDAAKENSGELPSSGGSRRILLVEDEMRNARLAQRILERAGYEVHWCALPDEALAMLDLRAHEFDLLLTDIVMPGISGLELVRRFKAQRPEAPALVVTGHNDVDTEQRVRAAGGDGLVAKPFTRKQLLRPVARLLEAASAPRPGGAPVLNDDTGR
ncbi:MAG: response regulator [Planctomycetota bacterium]|nr:MAG: response regulator [Planctomycetota bacterium]